MNTTDHNDLPDLEDLTSPQTEAAGNAYRVKLEVFEGPMDLLLHLIKREEVNIYDIPIARITEQYLEYLLAMQELDIDLAGDFLVMAATLIYIKSKMLLPRDPMLPEGAPEEDPRQELVQRLLEYQKYKAAAEMLWTRAQVEQAVFTRATMETDAENPEIAATVFDLFEAFRRAIERLKERVQLEIQREEITMAEKLAQIRQMLEARDRVEADELFDQAQSKRELITIFLALLELVKEAVIRLAQRRAFGPILILKVTDKAQHVSHEH
jgi:segregation and condensation protein A